MIVKVAPKSIAEQIDMQQDDLIVSMAGIEISEMQQVIDIVKKTQFGTWLPVSIKRGDEILELVAKFPPQAEGKSRIAD